MFETLNLSPEMFTVLMVMLLFTAQQFTQIYLQYKNNEMHMREIRLINMSLELNRMFGTMKNDSVWKPVKEKTTDDPEWEHKQITSDTIK